MTSITERGEVINAHRRYLSYFSVSVFHKILSEINYFCICFIIMLFKFASLKDLLKGFKFDRADENMCQVFGGAVQETVGGSETEEEES